MTPFKSDLKIMQLPAFAPKILVVFYTMGDLWRRFTEQAHPVEEAAYLCTVSRRDQEQLNRIFEENPLLLICRPEEREPVQTVAFEIQRGVIPSLIDLAKAFPPDPESPQSRQLLHRFTYFLSQAGELGSIRGEQLRLALGLRSRKNMLRHLEKSSQPGRSHPHGSPELDSHIHYLSRIIEETENALIPLLSEDPCIGDSIYLNTRQQPYPRWIQNLLRWVDSIRQFQYQAPIENF